MNMRRPMIVGIDQHPQFAEAQHCGHESIAFDAF
jgi:hypothetical protein